MARRTRSRAIVSRADRVPVWFNASWAATTLGGNAKTLIAVLNAAALALRPFTIIRSRGVIHVESDQIAASEATVGALGMIVVQDEATAAGIASIPGPLTEVDAQFFVYEPFVNVLEFGDITGFVEPAGTFWSYDSKAMRKVALTEDLAVTAELNVGAGAVITGVGRILVKLH